MGTGIIRRGIALLLIALPLAPSATAAEAARVDVVVTNVQNTLGHVRVGLCPRETFLETDCPYEANGPATKGETIVTVTSVPPGTYAVQVFHDENDNHKVDRSLVGIPTEGVGFSKDPSLTFGPPSFEDVAIKLGPEGGKVTVRLRHFP